MLLCIFQVSMDENVATFQIQNTITKSSCTFWKGKPIYYYFEEKACYILLSFLVFCCMFSKMKIWFLLSKLEVLLQRQKGTIQSAQLLIHN